MRHYRQHLAVSAVLWTIFQVHGFVPSILGRWNIPVAEQRQGSSRCFSSSTCRRRNISRLYVSMHGRKKVTEDFYAILGVSPYSSVDEIKRAYRKQAKKHHPDSNVGKDTTDKFHAVNRAYEVLSNPVLKSKYDMFGADGIGTSAASDEIKANRVHSGSSSTSTHGRSRAHGGGGSSGGIPADGFGMGGIHSNPADIPSGHYHHNNGATSGYARNHFDPADVMDRKGRGRYGPGGGGGIVGDNLQLTMEIDFETAIFGGRETIWIDHLETCDYCTGSGMNPGSRTNFCPTCGGAGFTVEVVKTAFGSLQSQETCPSCRGSGGNIDEYCNNCFGHGMEERSKQVDVTIPAGVEGYTRLRIRGEGNAGPKGGPPGDLFIFLQVLPHPIFERDGACIHSNHTVDYIDAILGNTIATEVVGGKQVAMDVPEGTQHEELIRLKGHGARSLIGESGVRGDHFVTVHVGIPDEISVEEEEILLQLRELQGKKKDRIPEAEDVKSQSSGNFYFVTDPFAPWNQPSEHRAIDGTTVHDAGAIRIDDFEVTYVNEGNSVPGKNAVKVVEQQNDTDSMWKKDEELRQNLTTMTNDIKEGSAFTATTQESIFRAESSETQEPVSSGSKEAPPQFFADVADSTGDFGEMKEYSVDNPIQSSTSVKKEPPTMSTSSRETFGTANELDKLRELLRAPVESSHPSNSKSKKKSASQADMLDTARELDKLRELLHAPVTASKKKTEAAAAAKAREIEAIKELEKLRQLLHEPLEMSTNQSAKKKARTQAEINAANELEMLRELIQPKETSGATETRASSSTSGRATETKGTHSAPEEAIYGVRGISRTASFAADIKEKVAGSALASGGTESPMKVTASLTFGSNSSSRDDAEPETNVDESTSTSEIIKSVTSLSSMGRFEDAESSDDSETSEAGLLAEVVEATLALCKDMKEGSATISEKEVVVEDAYSLSETIGPGGSDEDERSFAWEEITADSWRKNRSPSNTPSNSDDFKFEETLFSIFKL